MRERVCGPQACTADRLPGLSGESKGEGGSLPALWTPDFAACAEAVSHAADGNPVAAAGSADSGGYR